jgi:hypothetical protein
MCQKFGFGLKGAFITDVYQGVVEKPIQRFGVLPFLGLVPGVLQGKDFAYYARVICRLSGRDTGCREEHTQTNQDHSHKVSFLYLYRHFAFFL